MEKFGIIILILIVTTVLVIAFYMAESDEEPNTNQIEETTEEIVPELYGFESEDYNVEIFSAPGRINEHTIVSMPNNPEQMVAGANDYNAEQSGVGSGYAWVGYYSSNDGGHTWKNDYIPGYPLDSRPSVLTGYYGTGDPVLATSKSDNMVYMAGIGITRPGPAASSIWVARSFDSGQSFNSEDVFLVSEGYMIDRFHDKEWITVDSRNGDVYVCWTTFVAGANTAHIVVSFSRDQSMTWSPYVVVSEVLRGEWSPQGSQIVVDSEGVIHVSWIDYSENKLRIAHSYDSGLSYSEPQTITDVNYVWGIPNATYRTPTLEYMVIDNSGGNFSDRLYITWHDNRTGNTDILMVYGDVGGTEWSEPVRVNNDNSTSYQFFSATAVSPDGYVHVFFYGRGLDQNESLLDIYYAISIDGGNTFPFNTRVTTNSSNVEKAEFIGDYIGACAVEGGAYVAWCDLPNPENDGDIWTAKMVYPPELILPEN